MTAKPTYEELEQNLEELERIFNYSLDMIGAGSLDGYLTRVNSSFLQMLGYSESELLENPFISFIHDDDVVKTKGALADAIRGKKYIYISNRIRCKEGSYKWIEWKVLSLLPENRFFAVGRDIAKRKEVEEALRESEKKIRNYSNQTEQLSLAAASMLTAENEQEIFDNISKAIVEHSDFRRVIISLFKNKAPFRDIIGFGGVDKKIIDDLRKIEMPKSWYDGVSEQGEKIGRFSYYIPHKMKHILNQEAVIYGSGPTPAADDSWHPEDNLFIKMSNKRGEWIGVISVDESKSGLKPSRETVRPLEIFSSLISQIIILSRTYKEQKKLEQQLTRANKLESIGNLAGGIAHDFNNILSAILGFTELALDDVESGSRAEKSLQEVYTAGKRARDLVKQILVFARQSDEVLKPIRIDKIAMEVLKLIRSTIPTTIEIRHNIESDSLIMGNPTQVHQLFVNLCTNSAQSIGDAVGILEVGLVDVYLDENSPQAQSGLKSGNYLMATVSDTGQGVAPGDIDLIFEPYFTTKRVGEGTGMGLAMVHGIVESYGGKITIESELGEGAIFSIYLPITQKHESTRPYVKEDLPCGTERILLVDDELPIAMMGCQILERLGYQVTIRTSSVEALELFRSRPSDFDLIITDMTMPNMTGDILAMELIALKSDIPIILCTGYSKKISDQKALQIGIKAFAHKPLVRSELSKTVRKVLDEAQNLT